MSESLTFTTYQFQEFEELCVRMGTVHSRQILLIPPLFDESNRMRRFLVQVMRVLNDKGVGTALLDFPGSNESLFNQDQATLTLWQAAIKACAEQLNIDHYVASFRGGALLNDDLPHAAHWRFSPAVGKILLRAMMRTRIASDKEDGITTTMDMLTEKARIETIELAGNTLGTNMIRELANATNRKLDNCRTVRLTGDNKPADAYLDGSALWLRAEPGEDADLAAFLAADLAAWRAE